jgi:uncharacterized membrane protein
MRVLRRAPAENRGIIVGAYEERGMSVVQVIGIVLLVVGIILAIIGINASSSLADTVSTTFTGRLTEGTLWYIIGGIAIGLLGLLLALGVVGRPKS